MVAVLGRTETDTQKKTRAILAWNRQASISRSAVQHAPMNTEELNRCEKLDCWILSIFSTWSKKRKKISRGNIAGNAQKNFFNKAIRIVVLPVPKGPSMPIQLKTKNHSGWSWPLIYPKLSVGLLKDLTVIDQSHQCEFSTTRTSACHHRHPLHQKNRETKCVA